MTLSIRTVLAAASTVLVAGLLIPPLLYSSQWPAQPDASAPTLLAWLITAAAILPWP